MHCTVKENQHRMAETEQLKRFLLLVTLIYFFESLECLSSLLSPIFNMIYFAREL